MRDRIVHGPKLRELRGRLNMSQAELARVSGVSQRFIRYAEAGERQPSDPYAELLAAALNCHVDAFSDPKQATAA